MRKIRNVLIIIVYSLTIIFIFSAYENLDAELLIHVPAEPRENQAGVTLDFDNISLKIGDMGTGTTRNAVLQFTLKTDAAVFADPNLKVDYWIDKEWITV